MIKKPTYEELLELNRGLANQLVGMSDRLQESARQIAAQAWDEAVNEADRQWRIGAASAAILKADNPYRKPLDLPEVPKEDS